MTWNGRVTVHDDLSRLHASSRAGDTSREIGYSSVTEGEGSLDLLTESGAVRSQIGDQPDGRFGVSIWHRGQLRFVPDLIQDLQDEDEALSGRISGLGDRMISAEGRLDGHDSTLASHNTRITNAQARADSAHTELASEASRLDGRITNAWDRANSAFDRAGTGIANAATAQSRADSAHDRIDGLDYASPAQIAQLNDQIQVLRGRVQALEDWRASLPQG